LSALVFLNFLALSIFWHWAYLMKVVPETCCMLFYYTLYLTSVLCSYATLKEQWSGKVEIILKKFSFQIRGISAVGQPFFNFQLEFNEITQHMEGQTVYVRLLLFSSSLFFQIISTLPVHCSFKVA
jgi:hypothetical protein